jgi:flagellar FliJ protein
VARTRQLKTAKQLFETDERRKAQTLALTERQLREGEAKLAELKAYQADYMRDFAQRAGGGMDAARARDYQEFMARLEEALRQQAELLNRARAQRAEELNTWRGAAQRSVAVDRAVQRDRSEQERQRERREQRESDERAQRAWTTGTSGRAR